jgi:hypothetical protein
MVATLLMAATACNSGDDSSRAAADTAPVTTEPSAASATDATDISETTVADAADATPDDPTDIGEPGDADAPSDTGGPADPNDEGATDVPPTPSEPLYAAGDIDRGLQPFIDRAIDDLASRLGVDAAEITTHAAVLVVWPDTSLGCPQPDMRYAQVQTDGSVIELDVDGAIYRYHTGGARGPFICEAALTKPPPGEQLGVGSSEDD